VEQILPIQSTVVGLAWRRGGLTLTNSGVVVVAFESGAAAEVEVVAGVEVFEEVGSGVVVAGMVVVGSGVVVVGMVVVGSGVVVQAPRSTAVRFTPISAETQREVSEGRRDWRSSVTKPARSAALIRVRILCGLRTHRILRRLCCARRLARAFQKRCPPPST
jgi:hypothetical protein